jgi:hypothetical protein
MEWQYMTTDQAPMSLFVYKIKWLWTPTERIKYHLLNNHSTNITKSEVFFHSLFLFIYTLLNNAVISPHYILSNGTMTTNKEMENRHLPGGTEDKHEESQLNS